YTGTGNKNLLVDKAVTIAQAPGTGEVIIDMQDTGRALHLTADAVITGITFQNGRAVVMNDWSEGYGGAIYASSCSPQISHCVFLNNWADDIGGAVACEGSLYLTDCRFQDCASNGGGVYIYDYVGITQIKRCSFTGAGTGVYMDAPGARIDQCDFSHL